MKTDFNSLKYGNFKRRFEAIAWVLFFCAALIIILNHEIWRDEMHVFLLCRDSHSLSDLINNFGYDGHTFLWYLSVYVVTLLSHDPIYMQMLHVCIAGCSAFLILFYSPFSKLQKVGLVFSYYFLYEYAAISRDYAFAVLFIQMFCVAFTSVSRHRFLFSCFCLLLIAQTSIYGVLLSLSFSVLLLQSAAKDKISPLKSLSGFLFIALGVVIAILQLMPPADAGMATVWNTSFNFNLLQQSVAIIYKSFFVLPKPTLHFWNSNVLDNYSFSSSLEAILSVAVLTTSLFVFRRHKYILLAFLCAVIAIVAFTYVKYAGYLRHHGHIYLCFLACYWILVKKEKQSAVTGKTKGFTDIFFNTLLCVQLVASAIAVFYEWKYDFSGGKAASAFLKEKKLQHAFISADTDFIGMPVCGYLERTVFYPQSGRTGSFLIFDMQREKYLKFEEVFAITQQEIKDSNELVLYILDYPAPENKFPVKLIYKSDQTIVYDEQYFIYEQSELGL